MVNGRGRPKRVYSASIKKKVVDLYKKYSNAKKVASELGNIEAKTVLKLLREAGIETNKQGGTPGNIGSSPVARKLAAEIKALKPTAGGSVKAPDKKRKTLVGKRFVFTSAQNNTHIHENFFSSLLQFCSHRNADLKVSKFTYNQAGFQNLSKEDGSKELWYDHRLKEYFLDESTVVAKDLVFCGELNILPTADLPLSGFGNYTQSASAIIPHAKVQLQSMPRTKGEDPRFLYSTGAVTLRNYIQQKVGQKAEFHHVFGALYVEVDETGAWFARQLIADETGKFYDLDEEFTPTGVTSGVPVAAINWGDIHVEKLDPQVSLGGFGDMKKTLKPGVQFIHDLTDFSARNHHNVQDPYFRAERKAQGKESVFDELYLSAKFLHNISEDGTKTVVVDSNHDHAFKRWLRDGDVRQDPINARMFHYWNYEIYKDIFKNGVQKLNVYAEAIKMILFKTSKIKLSNVTFLEEDESYIVCGSPSDNFKGGIECGLHGHRGPNGSRGAPKALRTIGRKCNTGHTHSASIIDGVYTAGVSAVLDMGYNKGPSSWSHSHIVTYKNGKRAIVTMRGSKWKA